MRFTFWFRRLSCTVLLWVAGHFAAAQSATAPELGYGPRTLELVNAPYAPFMCSPDCAQGEGMDIEIAREALRRGGGYSLVVKLVPWSRVLLMLERGEADLTTTITRNSKRDQFLDWSVGYRPSIAYRFFSRKGFGPKLRSLDDLSGHVLGTTLGFSYPDAITSRPNVQIEVSRDIAATVRKLAASRTDYIVVNPIAGVWSLREQNLMGQLEEQPLVYSRNSFTYMAFSKARPHQAALEAMNKGLESMLKDGTIKRIEKKYLNS